MADSTPIIIKKKKSHGHGHHGGSWKVAYADFVTAMMAFFMVMWIMGMSESTRTTVAGYFNDPLGFTKNEPKSRVNIQPSNGSPYAMAGSSTGTGNDEVNNERQRYQKVKEEIEKSMEESIKAAAAAGDSEEAANLKAMFSSVDTKITNEGLLIELCENSGAVFFEIGSAQIRPGALKLISRLAPVVSKSGRPLVVEGHTDRRPYVTNGRGYDNMDLSNDRAQALRRALIGFGVKSEQFIAVTGRGDKDLKRADDPYHFSNRRVSLLLPFHTYSGERSPGLPKDLLESQIQGAFRRPVGVEP
jgi:chemotaxis protein MotB